jgi:GGDEF domain-containing protein
VLIRWRALWTARWWPSPSQHLLNESQLKRRASAWLDRQAAQRVGSDAGVCLLEIRVHCLRGGPRAMSAAISPRTQRLVGGLLRRALRGHDLLGQAGPGRFLVALPDVNSAAARMVSERLSAWVLEGQPRDADGNLLSLGVVVVWCAVAPGQDLAAAWGRLGGAVVDIPRGQRHRVLQVD